MTCFITIDNDDDFTLKDGAKFCHGGEYVIKLNLKTDRPLDLVALAIKRLLSLEVRSKYDVESTYNPYDQGDDRHVNWFKFVIYEACRHLANSGAVGYHVGGNNTLDIMFVD